MTTTKLAPVLFISHGAPTFALEPGQLGPRLGEIGTRLDGVRAILVVSPHWQTGQLEVMTTAVPETIHDFGGFPAALYALRYPAQGAPAIAEMVAQTLTDAGWPVRTDAQRGLDHGTWVPLLHMRPAADIPVFQVSLPFAMDARLSLALGGALAKLREQGIAIIGSGSMTHNLNEFRGRTSGPAAPYVTAFTEWVRDAVARRDLEALADYRKRAPHAERAHPTDEHFLPLLVALGASRPEERLEMLTDEVNFGMLSMESYGWGLPVAQAAVH